jgi:hypothetical protein
MSEQPQPSIWERSTLVRFFRWLFSWRVIRRILIVLAWTVTIIALLYGEENWRGRRAWTKYRKQLEARGEQLDFKAFIPKPIPDEQNFAATPLIQSWFPRNSLKWEDNFSKVNEKISSPRTDKGNRHFTDLVAWEMAFHALQSGALSKAEKFESDKLDLQSRAKAAPRVLEGLKESEVKFGELRIASQRPYARYPVIYKLDDPWGILLPHLAAMKGICLRLKLMACAKLAAGQSESALNDVRLILYLADSVKEEPVVISYLVRRACVEIAIQPIWEGLAERAWTDAQLRELQTRLQRFDFLADLDRPCDGERAAGILTADLLYKGKYRLSYLTEETSGASPGRTTLENFIARIAPHGWYYQEQVNYCRLYDSRFSGTFDLDKRRIYPREMLARERDFVHELSGGMGEVPGGYEFNCVIKHRYLASIMLPALGRLPQRPATVQTAVDQAMIACALERYRLANANFPDKLEALVPQFVSRLPTDLLSGQPYKYRRTDDGRFVLYSIGWNENDDGGTPGQTLFDEKQGDWVWQYPPVIKSP